MKETTLAEQFADWVCGFELADAPPPALQVARRAILDTLGVMVAGRRDDAVRRLSDVLPQVDGPCSVVNGQRTLAEHATLLNGMAAHTWDYDDTSYAGIMHGSAVVLPAALAMAQETGASQTAFIEAFIAGSEIAYTLGEISTHQHYFRGWWSTATFGLVGATVAAARLLDCDRIQMASAIGLAASSSGVTKAAFGHDGKALLVGETARRAVTMARSGSAGLSGPLDGLDGELGFLGVMNGGVAEPHHAETLGRRWRLLDPGLLVKTNPVCSAANAAIEQMAALMEEILDGAGAIETIKAEVPELVANSLRYDNPKTPRQAQFSLPYALACVALHGRVQLSDLTTSAVVEPAKLALMAKVETQVAADLSTNDMRDRYPESARLTITLGNGKQRSGFCGDAYGMPSRPLSDADLVDKFRSCLAFADLRSVDIDLTSTDLLRLAARLLN